ncbi:hypothetical protein B0H11DRAFT_2249509 [Mycena galericulata]|nr:hypothetical protein B0H11DRAFT_2249509 [Mycena galericulata]
MRRSLTQRARGKERCGQPRQFICDEKDCAFSTTNKGAFTRHYQKRHPPEPSNKPANTMQKMDYYPATAYYSESLPPPPSLTESSGFLTDFAQVCPTYGAECKALPPSLATDMHSSQDTVVEWVSWREEYDIGPSIIAVATGDHTLPELSVLTSRTEYLPMPADEGMAEKRLLWA